jgi:2-octaprenyl-6-methoxyphenol hydroxylase
MNYDVIIIGGGLVGASLARALRDQPLRLALIDAVSPDQAKTRDPRIIALAYGSRRILSGLGLWQALEANPIHHIHVSTRGHFGFSHLDRASLGLDALGYVAEAWRIGQSLHDCLRGQANLEIIAPARVESVEIGEEHAQVHLDSGQTLRARLLVAADGGDSPICRMLEIPSRHKDYRQTAIIAKLQVERPQPHTAYERFTPGGPLALLPLAEEPLAERSRSQPPSQTPLPSLRLRSGQATPLREREEPLAERSRSQPPSSPALPSLRLRSGQATPLPSTPLREREGGWYSLVWSVAGDRAQAALDLPDQAFLRVLQQGFGWRLGKFLAATPRAAYPLTLRRVTRHIAPRLAVIGNAAHTLHPVAGQGLNLGLRDVAALAEVLAGADGQDPGDLRLLQAYAAWREDDQRLTARLTDSLVEVFSNDFPPLALARNFGLLALDRCAPLKSLLMRQTAGLRGKQPRLARGLPLGKGLSTKIHEEIKSLL